MNGNGSLQQGPCIFGDRIRVTRHSRIGVGTASQLPQKAHRSVDIRRYRRRTAMEQRATAELSKRRGKKERPLRGVGPEMLSPAG